MKIDIVDLLKQVGLEYDSNIRKANLEMKWNLPEHKIVLWLDSQKTYRIFREYDRKYHEVCNAAYACVY